ncbi:MAG: GIY-YIG nuclease family protein [Alistipes shahii]|uniref:GIY-YIG nuclease family protein n=1 Tax=Alistipes shahii TaxID=328814 RepID=UPI00399D33C8
MGGTENNSLREQVALLPLSPGVYQFLDRSGTIIYVGKAKSLRKRVSSYFVRSKEHSPKVRVLVKQIAAIRHIVVGSETDALLLENSLIKTLQPRYNILLKDDKTYPWIVVRREHFPRVQSTRTLTRDGSQYFGPYGSVMMQHSVLDFIREVVPARTRKPTSTPGRSPGANTRSACNTTSETARGPASDGSPRRSTDGCWRWSFRC